MKKLIGFFSSDARNLYLDDVYRALALPEDYVLKFRYQKKYICDAFIANLNKLLNQEGIIFFTQGNNIDLDPDKRNIKNLSIRKVEIINLEDDDFTGLVYFYLKLKEFVDYTIKNSDSTSKDFPPYKFVSEICGEEGLAKNWTDRVDAVKPYFNNVLFFNVSRLCNNKNEAVKPFYKNYESFFEFDDEAEYFLKVSLYDTCYDTTKGNCSFNIEQDSTYITLNKPKKLSIGAVKDNKTIDITTHTLESGRITSFIKIFTETNDDSKYIYDILLKVCLNRKKSKTFFFGLISFFAALALFVGQFGTRLINPNHDNILTCLIVIALGSIAVGVTSGFLYNFFNKK